MKSVSFLPGASKYLLLPETLGSLTHSLVTSGEVALFATLAFANLRVKLTFFKRRQEIKT